MDHLRSSRRRLQQAVGSVRTFMGATVAVVAVGCGVNGGLEDPNDDVDAGLAVVAQSNLEPSKASTESRQYVHPLRGIGQVAGGFPAVDVHTSVDGKRFALTDWGEGSETSGSSSSALVKLERDTHRPDYVAAAESLKDRKAADPGASGSIISPTLAQQLATSLPEAIVTVVVRTSRTEQERPFITLRRSIAEGKVNTEEEYSVEYRRAMAERASIIANSQQAVLAELPKLGGLLIESCGSSHCLIAQFPAASVSALAQLPGIEGIEANYEISPGVVTGQEVRQGTQIAQFMMSCTDGSCTHRTWPTWDGENGSSGTNITAAVLEVGTFFDGHPGFTEAGGNNTKRIRGMYSCDANGCTSQLGWAANDSGTQNHATSVAGLILGDVHDAQDSAVSSFTDRDFRSGYAGEAQAYLYQTILHAGRIQALNHLDDRTVRPHVLNESTWSTGLSDPDCNGMSDLAKESNELYEKMILPIRITGNPGNNSLNCNVTPGADAIGAFTVGGHTNSSLNDDEADVRGGSIYTQSARGGASWSDGRNRSIIDVTAAACRRNMFEGDPNNLYGNSGCGTSFAAPTVTAAAIDYIDWYKQTVSSTIDEPGVLFANLLLFGDRQAQGGGLLVVGYDHLWGAGRLKMRRLDSEGLDGPFAWRAMSTCVYDDENVYSPAFTTYSDTDALKGVATWYDQRHESGLSIDDIDLYLEYESSPGVWSAYRSSVDSWDNKERVYVDVTSIGTRTWRWRIRGDVVTADNEGCGANGMMVNFAMFAEDSDRDDSDGPSFSSGIDAEQ